MKTIRIGGVPEHYNLPFYRICEKQPFLSLGYKVDFTGYSTGTGSMLSDLRDNHLDMSVLLTEGIITDQHEGNSAKIVAHYVKSPLVWGVHKHVNNAFDLKNGVSQKTRFAISRPKSGSHLMAYLYAKKFGVNIHDDQFEVVNNMNGAAMAMEVDQADLFLWEKYTIKPLISQGIFSRIDELSSPWEPFVIVANDVIQKNETPFIEALIAWLRTETMRIKQNRIESINDISTRFKLEASDVSYWLEQVEWDVKAVLSDQEFEHIKQILIDLNIIQPQNVTG